MKSLASFFHFVFKLTVKSGHNFGATPVRRWTIYMGLPHAFSRAFAAPYSVYIYIVKILHLLVSYLCKKLKSLTFACTIWHNLAYILTWVQSASFNAFERWHLYKSYDYHCNVLLRLLYDHDTDFFFLYVNSFCQGNIYIYNKFHLHAFIYYNVCNYFL